MPVRITSVWRRLPPERRLAAAAAFGLFLTLFLPWYQKSAFVPGEKHVLTAAYSVTGWGAFSFVEAAVLLVAISVLVLLFHRAEGRAFHLPGGDGTVITIAGGWTCFLIIWRMLDNGTNNSGQVAVSSGIEWGIFVALGVAGLLTYAGTRIRASRRPEPGLPGDEGEFFDGEWQTIDDPSDRRTRRSRSWRSSREGGSDAATAVSDGPRRTQDTATNATAAVGQPRPARPPAPALIVAARGPSGVDRHRSPAGWLSAPAAEDADGPPHPPQTDSAPAIAPAGDPHDDETQRMPRAPDHEDGDDEGGQLTIPLDDQP